MICCKCGHELWYHNTQGNGKCYGRNYKVINRKKDIYHGFPHLSIELEYEEKKCTWIN
jgi:hypothetical protein